MNKNEIKGWKVQEPTPKKLLYGPRGEIILKIEKPKIGFKVE